MDFLEVGLYIVVSEDDAVDVDASMGVDWSVVRSSSVKFKRELLAYV